MANDHKWIKYLSDKLVNELTAVEMVSVNGDRENCYEGCVNMNFAGIEGEGLLMKLNSIALSSGSACTSATLEPSYVLRALGLGSELAHSSLRFGINRFTTEKEVDVTIETVKRVVEELRDLSPLLGRRVYYYFSSFCTKSLNLELSCDIFFLILSSFLSKSASSVWPFTRLFSSSSEL